MSEQKEQKKQKEQEKQEEQKNQGGGRRKVVISLGGAFVENAAVIKKIASVLDELSSSCNLFVVTGGGRRARECIDIARELGANDVICDYIGIAVTRINAMLLISALENAYPEPLSDYKDVLKHAVSPYSLNESGDIDSQTSGREKMSENEKGVKKEMSGKKAEKINTKIYVMGGVSPGYTTDAVAAILAEYLNADLLINVTTVDGVYDEDPRVNPSARKYEQLTPSELLRIVMHQKMKAGASIVIDPVAAKIIERSGVKAVVVDGRNPENILKAFNGEKVGTIIERNKGNKR